MGQITSGVRAILSSPIIYNSLQRMMGAHKSRQELVDKFICPASGSRILDIGSGTSEILQHLPANIEYWGFDISLEYVSAAKKKYGARGHFHCGLLSESLLADLPKFDRVLALGVLHHLDDGQAREVFSLAHKALEDNGRMIAIDPCLADDQSAIARYLISKDRGQNVRDAEAYATLANGSFPRVHGEIHHRRWIPYTHWIMECSK
ncbi:methyltransferase domain-containing protein [Hydrogenophaga taeniospiralis]|uniref:class I SAM-dependent methyltransferase n=1 Tax=Hydrogenophaga taeniospiralis TaxID=65656 RepID=UPI001CF9EB75|nr:class I SAM-dependent methyltransferase [Hydrogenophaga taeniospiralis]MCB4364624.1 methyltransferase domain-containing protein [Hydrogenophaga taeniospiralis]